MYFLFAFTFNVDTVSQVYELIDFLDYFPIQNEIPIRFASFFVNYHDLGLFRIQQKALFHAHSSGGFQHIHQFTLIIGKAQVDLYSSNANATLLLFKDFPRDVLCIYTLLKKIKGTFWYHDLYWTLSLIEVPGLCQTHCK